MPEDVIFPLCTISVTVSGPELSEPELVSRIEPVQWWMYRAGIGRQPMDFDTWLGRIAEGRTAVAGDQLTTAVEQSRGAIGWLVHSYGAEKVRVTQVVDLAQATRDTHLSVSPTVGGVLHELGVGLDLDVQGWFTG